MLLLLPCLALAQADAKRDAQTGVRRDAWQRPQEVLDALGVRAGSVVADIGCGEGYFTFHLARRVGTAGRVYCEDVNKDELAKVQERAAKEQLAPVSVVLGKDDDPRLPAGALDVALIVNSYHEMRAYDAMLAGLFRALKPGGRLGIIEPEDEPGKEREHYYRRHRIPEELVRADAARAGFRFLREEAGFERPASANGRKFYFLIFEKPL